MWVYPHTMNKINEINQTSLYLQIKFYILAEGSRVLAVLCMALSLDHGTVIRIPVIGLGNWKQELDHLLVWGILLIFKSLNETFFTFTYFFCSLYTL